MSRVLATVVCTAGLFVALAAAAREIGSVDTKFNLLSPDDSINVEAFEDSKVDGVVCYLSKAQKGGYLGAAGLAEDTSDAAIACRQVGPISILERFDEGERVFRERRSIVFKSLKVVRFCDTKHNTLVYLAYSEKVIEGSPKNSVSAVPILPWPQLPGQRRQQEASQPQMQPRPQPQPLALCRYDS